VVRIDANLILRSILSPRHLQSRPLVELPIAMGSVPIHVMQKHLCQPFAIVRFPPMRNIDSAIDQHISRQQRYGHCISGATYPDRPRHVRRISEAECSADLTSGPVHVPLQKISVLVKPQIGVRRVQSKPNLGLDRGLNALQQSLGGEVAICKRRPGNLRIARGRNKSPETG
jgi:hypothetical protein